MLVIDLVEITVMFPTYKKYQTKADKTPPSCQKQ
jgi:hypothetical protein